MLLVIMSFEVSYVNIVLLVCERCYVYFIVVQQCYIREHSLFMAGSVGVNKET